MVPYCNLGKTINEVIIMTVVGDYTSPPAQTTSYTIGDLIGGLPHQGVCAQQGWQCPVCGRVYAPWVSQCFYCGEGTPSVTWKASTSPAVVEKKPEVCSCWHLRPDGIEECWGTKEREECHCCGVTTRCDRGVLTVENFPKP